MKLERKVRLCSAAAAVLIAAIALTGCGGSKTTASSAAASSVAASTAAATNNSCGEGVTWALADGTLTISGTGMSRFVKLLPVVPRADLKAFSIFPISSRKSGCEADILAKP